MTGPASPDHTLDAIRALVDEHDVVAAELEEAHAASRAAVAGLSTCTLTSREHGRICDVDVDDAAARIRRAEADLNACGNKGALLAAVRHLLDVVDRQHEMLERHQFKEAPGWDVDGPVGCIECTLGEGVEPHNDCTLDALLRETA